MIRAGRLLMTEGSIVAAFTDSGGESGDFGRPVRELLLNDSSLFTDTAGDGDAGKINVDTARIELINDGTISSSTFGAGGAGAVEIEADDLVIRRGGQIATDTFGRGDAGSIMVRAGRLTIDSSRPDRLTGISSSVALQEGAAAGEVTGNAGTVTIQAGRGDGPRQRCHHQR